MPVPSGDCSAWGTKSLSRREARKNRPNLADQMFTDVQPQLRVLSRLYAAVQCVCEKCKPSLAFPAV